MEDRLLYVRIVLVNIMLLGTFYRLDFADILFDGKLITLTGIDVCCYTIVIAELRLWYA